MDAPTGSSPGASTSPLRLPLLPWTVGGQVWTYQKGNPPGYPVGIPGWSMPTNFQQEAEYRSNNRLPPIVRSASISSATHYVAMDLGGPEVASPGLDLLATYSSQSSQASSSVVEEPVEYVDPPVLSVDPVIAAYSGTPAPTVVDSNPAVYLGPPAPVVNIESPAEYLGPPAPVASVEQPAVYEGPPAPRVSDYMSSVSIDKVTMADVEALWNMPWTVGGKPWDIRKDDFPPGYPRGIPGYSMPADFDLEFILRRNAAEFFIDRMQDDTQTSMENAPVPLDISQAHIYEPLSPAVNVGMQALTMTSAEMIQEAQDAEDLRLACLIQLREPTPSPVPSPVPRRIAPDDPRMHTGSTVYDSGSDSGSEVEINWPSGLSTSSDSDTAASFQRRTPSPARSSSSSDDAAVEVSKRDRKWLGYYTFLAAARHNKNK